MVTRTVTTTVDVLCINIETAETGIKSFVLSQGMVKDDKTMLETECGENWKGVAIKSFKEEETFYGMTEHEFMKYAKVLPPR